MQNRVYYGEYSLEHWLELILKQNIVLPDYQRYFVWNESKVHTLLDTLRRKQFVPPVTIGAFKTAGVTKNLILDGQQRLTSILLAYLNLYPDRTKHKDTIERFADENDNLAEPEEEFENLMEWTFKEILKRGNSKKEILQKIIVGNYKSLNIDLPIGFLKNTFLGFSYLVPYVEDEKEQQKYYSSVFRNINVQGQVLLAQESRASLYFLDKNLEKFFAPLFFKRYLVKTSSSELKADFVRYMSLLSEYKHAGQSTRIARGYKLQMEKYYEQYIYSIVGEARSDLFSNFSDMFPSGTFEPAFLQLAETIEILKIPKVFFSIIEADVYLFGLIYSVVFCEKKIMVADPAELTQKIVQKVHEFKEDQSHARAPSALKYLRKRIDASINLYSGYATK